MSRRQPSPFTLGKTGEEIALHYLKKKSFKIIARNFRFLRGEIDIIAFDRKTLVFVEVKTRRTKDFGRPEESVTVSKQEQLKKIAQGFLIKNHLQDVECRFDIVSLSFDKDGRSSIRHIRNAF